MQHLFHKPAIAILLATMLMVGCHTPRHAARGAETEIRAVLEQQVREWNANNLAGFMETYARSDHTRFASGGDVSVGWQTVFDRYRKKYGERGAMGALTFSDLEITVLAPDAALAFGRWRLKREQDETRGLFTLIFRRTSEGWRIVHDHTSAADKQ
jgi:ketosteroid isomerase-like protein